MSLVAVTCHLSPGTNPRSHLCLLFVIDVILSLNIHHLSLKGAENVMVPFQVTLTQLVKGVFLVKSRHFGLPLATRPNWQSI